MTAINSPPLCCGGRIFTDFAICNCFSKNLGLKEAVYVISRGTNANGSWTIWSDGSTEVLGAWQSITNGLATVTYLIALPSASRMISIAERTSTDPGVNTPRNIHTSTVLDDTVTKTGFKARCQLLDGQASSSAFSWRVYAPI